MIYLEKTVQAHNGGAVSHHQVTKVEVNADGDALNVYISSWYQAVHRTNGQLPLSQWVVKLDLANLGSSSGLLADITSALTASGELQAAEPVVDGNLTLPQAKEWKKEQINRARLAANRSTFDYSGKTFACDELSRSDIDGVTSSILLTGNFPQNFPGAWKAVDNTYLAMPDTTAWAPFLSAMVAQGTQNFLHSQALKALIDAATTVEDVLAITWATVTQ